MRKVTYKLTKAEFAQDYIKTIFLNIFKHKKTIWLLISPTWKTPPTHFKIANCIALVVCKGSNCRWCILVRQQPIGIQGVNPRWLFYCRAGCATTTLGSVWELCYNHLHLILKEKVGQLMTRSVYGPLCYLVVWPKKTMLYNCKKRQCVIRWGRKTGITF